MMTRTETTQALIESLRKPVRVQFCSTGSFDATTRGFHHSGCWIVVSKVTGKSSKGFTSYKEARQLANRHQVTL